MLQRFNRRTLPQRKGIQDAAKFYQEKKGQKGSFGLKAVATKFGVAKTTLGRYLKAVADAEAGKEPKPDGRRYLTDPEERILAEYCAEVNKHNTIMHSDMLEEQMVLTVQHKHQLARAENNDVPELQLPTNHRKWSRNFMHRQPLFLSCRGARVDNVRFKAFNPETVADFFKLIEEVLSGKHGRVQDVWNGDETMIFGK